jgi:hypothetical protein
VGRGPPPYRTTTAAAEAADPSTTAVPHIEGSVTGSGSAPRLAPEQGGAAGRPGPPWSLRATIPPSPPSSRAWRCAGVHLMHLVGTNRAGHLHHDPPLHLASPISRDAAGSTLERKLPPAFRTVSDGDEEHALINTGRPLSVSSKICATRSALVRQASSRRVTSRVSYYRRDLDVQYHRPIATVWFT